MDNRYLVEVHRTRDYFGELRIFDCEKNNREIACWEVHLSFRAFFGSDATDVCKWQEQVINFIDNAYNIPKIEMVELLERAKDAIPEAAEFELDNQPIESHCGKTMVKFIAYEDKEKKHPTKVLHLCRFCEYYFIMNFGA